MIKSWLSMVIAISIFSYLAVEHYFRKLYNEADSLQAVKKLKYLTWIIIALEAIVVIGLTYQIRFSPAKVKIVFFGFIAADIFFIWNIFRWIGFLQAFKSPQKLICQHYLKLHRKYMEAGQNEQADAAAKKVLEWDSQSCQVWLRLADNCLFANPFPSS